MAVHAPIAAAEQRQLLVDADLPITTVAAVFKVSAPTIRRHCRAHGIVVDRGPGPKSKLPPADEIVDRIRAGETATDIAKVSGVTRPAVVTKLARAGYALLGGTITKIGSKP